jgi:hypothetical protein
MRKFQVGDHVRKRTGKKIAIITRVDSYWTHIKYVDSGGVSEVRNSDDNLILIEDTTPELDLTTSLFSFTENGKEHFARLIGKDENGSYVLEVKGAGISVKSPSDVKEVLPHTIEVKFYNNSDGLHYEVPKGAVEVGDVVINTNLNIAVVRAVDTQRKKARDGSHLRVLSTHPVIS